MSFLHCKDIYGYLLLNYVLPHGIAKMCTILHTITSLEKPLVKSLLLSGSIRVSKLLIRITFHN